MIGTRVRRCLIEEKLPGSGMGEVYRARDEQLDRDVVIKFLPQQFASQPSAVSRFIREARAASALNHPNIITILDAGKVRTRQFIIMELVRGRTLRELIGHETTVETLLPVMIQIARALAVAHAAGIIHRDIKPENIMVRDDGYVKVLDFGLARWENEAVESVSAATRTMSGSLVGTMRYMSPEQANGKRPPPSTDTFSLGIVFYELLTGKHPFDAPSELEALQAICSGSVVSPRHWAPAIPPMLEALILRMLERTPQLRPGAADVVQILEEVDVRSMSAEAGLPSASRPQLVGRRQELVKLRAFLDSTQRGHGLLVLITGEPGIGKTSLVEEFLNEQAAARRNCAVGRGFCSERSAGTEAYQPLLEALEDLIRGKAPLASLMKRLAPNWFLQVMRYSSEEAAAALPGTLKTATRELLSRELVTFLQEAFRTVPVILFLDDLHWADESTLDLLAYISKRLDSMGILIVANYRPEEFQLHNHRFLQAALDLQAHRICQKIDLGFLGVADVEAYVSREFTQNNFPAVFPKLIHAKTEGNPFFMVEVLRYLRDKQIISESKDVWVLSEKLPDIERDLPQSIIGMVQRKIDVLSDADRRLLSAASVQGFEFDSPIVARTLSIDVADTEERLYTLHRVHGLIQPLGEKELPQGTIAAHYKFVHFLYYGTLFNAIQPARKASWSGVAASALIHFHEGHESDIAAQVGFLFESARNLPKAAHYFSVAAEHAFKVFAFGEAELLARRGLQMLETGPREIAATEDLQDLERRLLVTLGNSLLASKGYGTLEVQKVFSRARQLCVGDSPRLFGPLWGLQTYFVSRLELDSARGIAGQLLRLAENSTDASVLGIAHLGAGVSHYLFGELEAAKAHFECFRTTDDPSCRAAGARRFGLEPGIMMRGFGARVLLWMGYPEQCKRQLDEALAMARELSHVPTLAFLIAMASTTEQWHQEVDKVGALAKELVALGTEHGMQIWVTEGAVFEGWFQTQQSKDSAYGIEMIRRNLAAYSATGTELFRPQGYPILAEAYLASGRFAEGLQVLKEAYCTPWWKPDSPIIYSAELIRVEGDLLAASGDMEGAEERLTRSLNVAQQLKLRPLVLRTSISLGKLWKSQGRPEKGYEILAPVYDSFSEGADFADLKEAKAVLQSLQPPA